MPSINEALRLSRVFHDLSQTELAKKLHISKSYLSEIESGKKNVNIDLLERYGKVFDIPASSLLLFSEKMDQDTLSERTRIFMADKVIAMMNWVVAKEGLSRDEKST